MTTTKPQSRRSMERLVRAHSCAGCRAYETRATGVIGGSTTERYCSLGFGEVRGKPLGPCPKPRSIRALVEYSLRPNAVRSTTEAES